MIDMLEIPAREAAIRSRAGQTAEGAGHQEDEKHDGDIVIADALGADSVHSLDILFSESYNRT